MWTVAREDPVDPGNRRTLPATLRRSSIAGRPMCRASVSGMEAPTETVRRRVTAACSAISGGSKMNAGKDSLKGVQAACPASERRSASCNRRWSSWRKNSTGGIIILRNWAAAE